MTATRIIPPTPALAGRDDHVGALLGELAPAKWGRYAGGARACYGHTLIADPWGHVIAKAQDKVGYIVARLDLEEVERVRARMPCAGHRVL